MVLIFLITIAAVSAFTLAPPSGPFTTSVSTIPGPPVPGAPGAGTASSSFSLASPSGPFSNTPVATSTVSTSNASNVSNTSNISNTSTSGGSATSSGSSAASAGAGTSSPASSGGGGGGGGGGGLIRIDLSGDTVIRFIPLGRNIQFSRNGRYYPSLLMLRRIDASKGTSSWAIEAKFYDLAKSASQLWDLDRDKKPDVVVQVISIERNGVTISAKSPVAQPAATPAPASPVSSTPSASPASSRAPEPVYVPGPEPIPAEIVFVEEEVTTAFPVRTLALGVGFLLAVVIVMFAIKGLKSSGPHTIQEYIEQGLSTGHSESEIRRRLESAGWKKSEIDAAMNEVEGKSI